MSKEQNDQLLPREELIQRYADIHKITYEEAEKRIGADTAEEIMTRITNETIEKINNTQVKLNRKQRRALQKKYGKNILALEGTSPKEQQEIVNDTARKLNYIDLIQKFRALNEQREKENKENGEYDDEEN